MENAIALTFELSTEEQQVLEACAHSRGVSLPKYLQGLAAHDAQRAAAPGSFTGNGHEVEDFLRERREEVERDNAQDSTPMPREQFDARLQALRERTLQGQAAKRASREQAQQQARTA